MKDNNDAVLDFIIKTRIIVKHLEKPLCVLTAVVLYLCIIPQSISRFSIQNIGYIIILNNLIILLSYLFYKVLSINIVTLINYLFYSKIRSCIPEEYVRGLDNEAMSALVFLGAGRHFSYRDIESFNKVFNKSLSEKDVFINLNNLDNRGNDCEE